MGNLLKSELFKLRKDRSFWILILLLIASSIVAPFVVRFGQGVQMISIKDFYINSSIGSSTYIIMLVPSILAGFFITKEYSAGTMKNIGASGNSRIRIYFAKLISFSLGASILSIIIPIVMTVIAAFLYGFNNMPDLDFFIRTIALISLFAAAYGSIMSLFSIIFTESGVTIAFLIIFFRFSDTVLYELSTKISILQPVFNNSIFKQVYDISKTDLSSTQLLKMVITVILTFIAFGLFGSLIFQKKEIK